MQDQQSLSLEPHLVKISPVGLPMPDGLDWLRSESLVDYSVALRWMEDRVRQVINHEQGVGEAVWLLQHPPLYTAGTSANPLDLLVPSRFPVYQTGRGGQFTYHGPGQRVGYMILNLNKRGRDLRKFIHDVEEWLILSLDQLGVRAVRRSDRVGIWVCNPNGSENKIAAIGVRVRKWVTFHGFALNVHPDLEHFSGIVPCGISQSTTGFGVTSLHQLGVSASLEQVDHTLMQTFHRCF